MSSHDSQTPSKRFKRFLVLLCIALVGFGVMFWLRAFPRSMTHWGDKRAAAASSISAVEVAVVWPQSPDDERSPYISGVQLAIKEINDSGGVRVNFGGGQSKLLKIQDRYFDETSKESGVEIARELAKSPAVSAVIGHAGDSSIPASIIYNQSMLPLIVPANTDRAITLHRFPFVFRTAPRDSDIADAMVAATNRLFGEKRIRLALFYPALLEEKAGADSPTNIARLLEREARKFIEEYGNQVVFDVVSASRYERGNDTYHELIAPLLSAPNEFDAVLVADTLSAASHLHTELEQGIASMDQEQIPVLNLSGLRWLGGKDLYADLSEEGSSEFFRSAAALVLREMRKKVVVISSHDSYGLRLGAEIRASVQDRFEDPLTPLRLISHKTFEAQDDSHLSLVAALLEQPMDFVFLAGDGKPSVELVRELRERGMAKPIICGPGLESALLFADEESLSPETMEKIWEVLETSNGRWRSPEDVFRMVQADVNESRSAILAYVAEQAGKTFVASTFNPEANANKVREFVELYSRVYQIAPNEIDSLAAAGYQNIMLLKTAIEQAVSMKPQTLASSIALYQEDNGLFGNSKFDEHQDLDGMTLVFKTRDAVGTVITVPNAPTESNRARLMRGVTGSSQ